MQARYSRYARIWEPREHTRREDAKRRSGTHRSLKIIKSVTRVKRVLMRVKRLHIVQWLVKGKWASAYHSTCSQKVLLNLVFKFEDPIFQL